MVLIAVLTNEHDCAFAYIERLKLWMKNKNGGREEIRKGMNVVYYIYLSKLN